MNKPLVTILTAPKPFIDSHMRIIQRNALRSWLALGDQVQVIVLGDDEGIKQNCDDLGIMHIPGIRCNDKGTPLLSSMLEMAREKAQHHTWRLLMRISFCFVIFCKQSNSLAQEKRSFYW